jgi:CxxC motif-containing protein
MKEFTCIICPNGCHVTIDDAGNISGYSCPRGLAYVKQESTHPLRTVTSTVKVVGSDKCRVVPCKTETAIPKEKVFDCMKEINKVEVKLPVKLHQVLVKDVCGTGVNVIATKGIE